MADSEYTTMTAVPIAGPRGRRGIADIEPPCFWLVCGKQRWWTLWHPWFGPHVINRKTDCPKDKQPGERSMFWRVAMWWKNQGAVVVDGVGQWKFPPQRIIRYRMVGGLKVIAHDDGPDVLEMEAGFIDEWNGTNGAV